MALNLFCRFNFNHMKSELNFTSLKNYICVNKLYDTITAVILHFKV